MSVVAEIRGLDDLQSLFEQLPEIADEAAQLAVNDAARFGRSASSREIREQVAFKAGYLGSANDGADANLAIAKYASSDDQEAVIRARDPATSLARFATTQPRFGGGQKGVRVRVEPGSTKSMRRAFFIRLKRGQGAVTDDNFNLGLAIRLKKGERVENKRTMKAIGGGLYLLYGPSVAQVFDDVAIELQDDISNKLLSEFVRQFERLSRGQ